MPFAPFGIATVSRQVPPWLYEFLYALSASQGADPTRDEDQNAADPELKARNGEPYGELGLVTQKDHGLWQDQTGGPCDPQPGNIPGGARDVKRSADFSDGTLQTFAVDTGVWAVSAGVLTVAAAVAGPGRGSRLVPRPVPAGVLRDLRPDQHQEADRVAGRAMPTSSSTTSARPTSSSPASTTRPTSSSSATATLPAGTSSTWGSIPGGVKYDTWYDLLVAVNGTQVTVTMGAASRDATRSPRG